MDGDAQAVDAAFERERPRTLVLPAGLAADPAAVRPTPAVEDLVGQARDQREVRRIQELGGGAINAIAFSNENFVRPTGIIIRKNKILGQAGRYFIELLRKKAQ